MYLEHLMTHTVSDNKRDYNVCNHCGRKYYTWSGSIAHNMKQCDKVIDRDSYSTGPLDKE